MYSKRHRFRLISTAPHPKKFALSSCDERVLIKGENIHMDMIKREYAEKLLRYIDAAPMPYQSVDELEKMLVSAGAAELREDEKWSLEKGKLYYLKKNGTQLAAFRISGEPSEDGFRIGAAHHDAPGFRIKTAPSSVDFGYERLILEGYGGLIVHGWLDRPLSVAGRV